MPKSPPFYTGLFLVFICLTVGVASSSNRPINSSTALPAPAHIGHGLRAYLDPTTGQFVRPDDMPLHTESLLTAQAIRLSSKALTPPIERPSPTSGGGYTIDMREQYRPNRGEQSPLKAGS